MNHKAKALVVSFVLTFSCVTGLAVAQETTIPVLPLYTTDASPRMGDIDEQLNYFVDVWYSNDFHLTTPTTLVVMNPMPLGRNFGSSDPAGTLASAMADLDIKNRRTQNNADLIVLYVGQAFADPTECGYTNTPTGGFTPPLDTRYKDAAFISLITTSCSYEKLAAHELVHNFGGGHEYGPGLFSYSQAIWELIAIPGEPNVRLQSIMYSLVTCYPPLCDDLPLYSDADDWGDVDHDNAGTVDMTALSIANYRPLEGAPPTVPAPEDVRGWVYRQCNGSYTEHFVWWKDGGNPYPSGDIEYQIFAAQPPGYPFTYRWSEYWGQRYTYVLVIGAPADIKIRACVDGVGCSELSDTFYRAYWQCSPW